ncbi:acyltransferase family protein [Modestobacter lapidis]|nr:acyltransferase [Modestobacter lapidis]
MRTRDRYIDLLRALALIRVVTFHTFGWVWLPAIFPSIGIMFALGGALVTSSLDRAVSSRDFWRKRLRRLLPPFWVFGATVLVFMLAAGWTAGDEYGTADLTWRNAWLWIFPLADPPASDLGSDWVLPLWYIRTYLWFLLISPALLWLFRRWPLRTMAVPALVLPLMTLGLVDFPDPYWDIIASLCIYGICWMLGFAHHDGKIRDLPLGSTILAGLALMAGGLWFALSQQERYGSWNVDDNPMAAMLYFTGTVLILLRLYTRMDWLGRLPTLDAIVSLFNSRAMTIYLWGNFAIFLAPYVLARTPLARYHTDDGQGMALQFAATWALIFVAVLLVGWVEDVAAGRGARLLPWVRVTPVAVLREQPVPAGDGARPQRSFVAEGSRSPYGNFVVDPDRAAQVAISGSTVVLDERPAVRANFVVDDVTPEQAQALAGARPGREDAEVSDPDPSPIVPRGDGATARALARKGSPGSDAQ